MALLWAVRFFVALIGLAFASGVHAECVTPPTSTGQAASQASTNDAVGRVITNLTVNGEGPFRFIVDTGANRSVMSDQTARRLRVAFSGETLVYTAHGARAAPIAMVDRLELGALSVRGNSMLVMESGALLGHDGVLGADGLRDRRLMVDFERQCVEIQASHSATSLRGWGVSQGRLVLGHLVTAPARIGNLQVQILLDTGSDITFGNAALAEALAARDLQERPVSASALTAGAPMRLQSAYFVPKVELEGALFRNVTAYVGSPHVFDVCGLGGAPALLVGMDVLSRSGALAIDYRTGQLFFRTRRSG